ncbi:hypothetical protein [Aquabacterium commune]|uniref:hypothetical protein n=1 Tax=Aquabacterium commune TaxID=70586 RepID=UPI001414D75C|nr:hypothetical protein [Aquabacterium commune]
MDNTYDKGNGRLENLTVAARAGAIAVVNVHNGTVTHIRACEPGRRKAQLTCKVLH